MNYLIAIVETHENGASAQIRANEFVRPGHEKCMERASDYPTCKMSPLSERGGYFGNVTNGRDGIESFGHENCDMERIAAARRSYSTSQSRVLLESLVLGLSFSSSSTLEIACL